MSPGVWTISQDWNNHADIHLVFLSEVILSYIYTRVMTSFLSLVLPHLTRNQLFTTWFVTQILILINNCRSVYIYIYLPLVDACIYIDSLSIICTINLHKDISKSLVASWNCIGKRNIVRFSSFLKILLYQIMQQWIELHWYSCIWMKGAIWLYTIRNQPPRAIYFYIVATFMGDYCHRFTASELSVNIYNLD